LSAVLSGADEGRDGFQLKLWSSNPSGQAFLTITVKFHDFASDSAVLSFLKKGTEGRYIPGMGS
jgi:hypothetical protein